MRNEELLEDKDIFAGLLLDRMHLDPATFDQHLFELAKNAGVSADILKQFEQSISK